MKSYLYYVLASQISTSFKISKNKGFAKGKFFWVKQELKSDLKLLSSSLLIPFQDIIIQICGNHRYENIYNYSLKNHKKKVRKFYWYMKLFHDRTDYVSICISLCGDDGCMFRIYVKLSFLVSLCPSANSLGWYFLNGLMSQSFLTTFL